MAGVSGDRPRILFLGHAAERTGPPILLLDWLRWLRRERDWELGVALLEGGELLGNFEDVATTWVLQDWLDPGPTQVAWRALWKLGQGERADQLAASRLRWPARSMGDWDLAWVNSVGTARLLRLLPSPPRRLVAHVHELSTGLDHHTERATRDMLFARADAFVSVSEATSRAVRDRLDDPTRAIDLAPGWAELDPVPGPHPPTRAELGIPDEATVVGSSGVMHWRKAPDLLISLAERLRHDVPSVHLLWIGGDPTSAAWRAAEADLRRAGLGARVTLVPHQPHPRDWFRLLDIFVLPAREDAFPLVCLEAAAAGLPIVCFASAGGAPELVRDDAGVCVPYPDLDALAAAVRGLASDPARRAAMGAVGAARVRQSHTLEAIAPRLTAIVERELAR